MSRDGAIVVHFSRKTLSHAPEMCRLPGFWNIGSLGTLKFFAGAGVKPRWTFNTFELYIYIYTYTHIKYLLQTFRCCFPLTLVVCRFIDLGFWLWIRLEIIQWVQVPKAWQVFWTHGWALASGWCHGNPRRSFCLGSYRFMKDLGSFGLIQWYVLVGTFGMRGWHIISVFLNARSNFGEGDCRIWFVFGAHFAAQRRNSAWAHDS